MLLNEDKEIYVHIVKHKKMKYQQIPPFFFGLAIEMLVLLKGSSLHLQVTVFPPKGQNISRKIDMILIVHKSNIQQNYACPNSCCTL